MTIIAQARLELPDPHDCTDGSDTLTILHAIHGTLVRRVGQGFVPCLAESWKVSGDARRWIFHLHPDARFADGSPVKAEAVAANLVRMARPDKGYTLGAPAVWRQYLGGAEYRCDGHTLTIALAEPMADLLDVLEQAFIVSPACFHRLDAGIVAAQFGAGPYALERVGAHEITAKRAQDHFDPGRNDSLTWRRVPDAADRLELLRTGAVQVANGLDYNASRSLGAMRHEYLSPVAIIYLLNAARGPLADARVRRALSLGVDRDALVADVMHGAARPLRGFVSPAHFGAGDGAGTQMDLDEARRLLGAAGFGDGLTLGVDCPTRLPDEAERLTAALAGQLSAIGITLDVHVHSEREDYAHMVRRKEIRDMCVFDSSPMSTYRVLYEKIDSRVAGAWWQGYRNAEVETLIDKGRITAGRDERAAIWRQAYALLQDDPAWLTLYNPVRVIGLAGEHPDFEMPADGVIDAARLPNLEPR
jgi:ABC-type transport system substrate-binding protein